MAIEQTLSIIKPDAVAGHHVGQIYARFEQAGLSIVAAKLVQLSTQQVAAFYAEHLGRPFYHPLVTFMQSGPVMVSVLQGEDAIALHRSLLGATNPKDAVAGSIRADFGSGAPQNAAHGSDSAESAAREIAFFFTPTEIHPY
jgi:nucleoside-diphosphate kinase